MDFSRGRCLLELEIYRRYLLRKEGIFEQAFGVTRL
jgi:hypothetical protein